LNLSDMNKKAKVDLRVYTSWDFSLEPFFTASDWNPSAVRSNIETDRQSAKL